MKTIIFKRFIAGLMISLFIGGMSGRATAQSSGAGLDTDQPLEITADALEVQKAKQLAIFEGRVLVVQGELRLQSDRLIVHYSENSANDTNGASSIRRIDATGNVFLSSPRETAKGSRGVYDVENKLITLSGDVTLTQGQSVLKGQNMTLNLETGLSRIEGGVSSGGGNGRVRGLFVPQKKKK